jgi:signal peptidase I
VASLASAGVLTLALVGCGGGSHAAGPAAASVNAAGAAGGTSTTTTGTSTVGASARGAGTGTSSSSTTTGGGGSGSDGAGTSASGGAVKNGANDPAPSRGGADAGKGTAHGKSKGASKTAAGSGARAGGSDSAAGSGSTGSTGSGAAPSASTGVPYEVDTTSMEPTFQPEMKIYYDPTRTHPQIGEVVVFYVPAGDEGGVCGVVLVGGRACAVAIPGMTKSREISFKRVVGLPGDSIAIRKGHVIRNGEPESEPPTLPCEKYEKLNCEFPTPITIPAGHYFLMADNRGLDDEDSRIFGPVPQEYILGTVEGG